MADILRKIAIDVQLANDMINDAYTLYGYTNFIRIKSDGVDNDSGGEIHFILETGAMANAAALTTAGYGSAPAGSRITCTNAGDGSDGAVFYGKEEDGDNKWAAFTLGAQG